ncbi:hypothetical protein SSAG_01113 [Streptomyces sp. Mg1]|nr:hypothetical protein SSAG_01113 [Streptomyces sp. Mg1]
MRGRRRPQALRTTARTWHPQSHRPTPGNHRPPILTKVVTDFLTTGCVWEAVSISPCTVTELVM